MCTEKQYHELLGYAEKCVMELGPLELEDPADIYPLVALTSNGGSKLRFTKNVVLATQEFTTLSTPSLMPTIHLYGPENFGNYEIVKCHPAIRPCGGQGINILQKQEITLRHRSDMVDLAWIQDLYKDYIPYLENVFKITNTLQEKDLINLCYDSVFGRESINGSHNILNESEALSDVVLTTICRNALRMMRNKSYKPNSITPPTQTKYLNATVNRSDNIECLKNGTTNNIAIFLTIYTLNALEFPSTIDHLCQTLSTRYRHKLEEYSQYIESEYNSKSEYNDLRIRKPESPHVRKALEIETEVENIRKEVYQNVEQSILMLKKHKIITMQGKKILPNSDSLELIVNGEFNEIPMPSVGTIRKRRKNIQNFNSYLRRKKNEWKNN